MRRQNGWLKDLLASFAQAGEDFPQPWHPQTSIKFIYKLSFNQNVLWVHSPCWPNERVEHAIYPVKQAGHHRPSKPGSFLQTYLPLQGLIPIMTTPTTTTALAKKTNTKLSKDTDEEQQTQQGIHARCTGKITLSSREESVIRSCDDGCLLICCCS